MIISWFEAVKPINDRAPLIFIPFSIADKNQLRKYDTNSIYITWWVKSFELSSCPMICARNSFPIQAQHTNTWILRNVLIWFAFWYRFYQPRICVCFVCKFVFASKFNKQFVLVFDNTNVNSHLFLYPRKLYDRKKKKYPTYDTGIEPISEW